jgi:bifunctional non-homologous end joining protein LigD
MAALEEYRRKRRLGRTPEPMPADGGRAGAGNSFVIHEHHARALHWDLRLERDGVLASWAVPKGLPTDPKVNRLAVHVEDHPLEYGRFEGTIGDHEYGAGTVKIWDAGTYTTEKWTDREVKFVLHGQRATGRFVLFQTDGKNWMLHRMDAPAAADWTAMPESVEPMQASAGPMPADERGWSFEMRWTGLRAQVRAEGGRGTITAAGGRTVTTAFPELRGLSDQLGSTQALLDGVITRFDRQVRPEPDALALRLKATAAVRRTLARDEPVTFLAFDLLHLDGVAILAEPYVQRRELLITLDVDGLAWQTPPAFTGTGAAAVDAARALGLGGLIAKRLDSPYRAGEQSLDWLDISVAAG